MAFELINFCICKCFLESDSMFKLHTFSFIYVIYLILTFGWYCLLWISNVPPIARASRGPSKYLDIWDLPNDQVIEFPLNSMHQPVDEGVRTFTGWLGTIAWKLHMCPIRYLSWKAMPEELKEECWRLVEELKKL